MAGECKSCRANREKKGFKYYTTEQQRRIAQARSNGEDVNVTVVRKTKPASSHPHKRAERSES